MPDTTMILFEPAFLFENLAEAPPVDKLTSSPFTAPTRAAVPVSSALSVASYVLFRALTPETVRVFVETRIVTDAVSEVYWSLVGSKVTVSVRVPAARTVPEAGEYVKEPAVFAEAFSCVPPSAVP